MTQAVSEELRPSELNQDVPVDGGSPVSAVPAGGVSYGGGTQKRWYFAEFGQQIGPVDDVEFSQLMLSQRVGPMTMIWRDGMPNWMTLTQVRNAGVYGLPNSYTLGGGAYTMAPPTSGLAITSLVCGILGLIACFIITAIPAVVCGHMAMSQIKNSNGMTSGKGMAIAGLIMGYLVVAITLVWLLMFVGMVAFSPSFSP